MPQDAWCSPDFKTFTSTRSKPGSTRAFPSYPNTDPLPNIERRFESLKTYNLGNQPIGSSERASENPPGGLIDFDETNQLSGVVFESLSQTLIDASQPPTIENLDFAYEGFLEVLATLAKNGITSVSDAGGYWPRDHHSIWSRAEFEGTLTVRANNTFYVYPEKNVEEQLDAITALRMNDADNLVRFNQVKIYIDGIISKTTAALLSPKRKRSTAHARFTKRLHLFRHRNAPCLCRRL